MTPVIDHRSNVSTAKGVKFRGVTPGPENEMVDQFLANLRFTTSPELLVTIFREPKLESGYPDLVFVAWDAQVARRWPAGRSSLDQNDCRLMAFLSQAGEASESDLCQLRKQWKRSLQVLSIAGFIKQNRKSMWCLSRPANELLAVRAIIAVEAKISDWTSVLEQAHLNTWFASESAILVPHIPQGGTLARSAKERGLQIWSVDLSCIGLENCYSEYLHHCYAAWLFNEWSWRHSLLGE